MTDSAPFSNIPPQNINHTIIIGAGPAGLSVGACLKQHGTSCIILEQSNNVGAAWHRHYERLHLHTAKALSELPFFHFPKAYPRYLSRLQVIEYLEAYARQFQLTPRFGQRVISARFVENRWEIQTQDSFYSAANLVIATGYTRERYLPHWPGQETFKGMIFHSSQYQNGGPFRDQKVLVVGFGNSGGEIAIDLWEHGAQPSLAIRSPVNVLPRDLFGIPIQAIAIVENKLPLWLSDALNFVILRLVMGDLRRYGLRQLSHGAMTQIQRHARIPLIDVGTLRLIKRGQITVRPGIERFTDDGVIFTDGMHGMYETVILATGYRPRVDNFLQGAADALDDMGTPVSSGYETLPGLYFCGYSVSAIGMLRQIALEAQRICAAITRKRKATSID